VRASRPLNHLATTTLRGLFAVTGSQPEFWIKHLPRTGVTAVKLPNGRILKLEADGEEWIPTQLFWRGWQGYEPETAGVFYELAKSAGTVIDVGAHGGFYSLLASLANPHAQVVAFEPLARVFASLERNVRLNELENVSCVNTAVGAISGVQDFYFPDEEQPVSSSLRSEMLIATFPLDSIKHVPVPVITLDQFVAEQGIAKVDLIKLDTERTEHDVLAGARTTLARDKPEIFCEVWPDAGNQKQLENILRPLGYRFYQLLPEGPIERAEIVGSEEFLNYLFTTRRFAASSAVRSRRSV
jgi:FkbM family methyltransferase